MFVRIFLAVLWGALSADAAPATAVSQDPPGNVGLGSFDDTTDWDNFRLRGVEEVSR